MSGLVMYLPMGFQVYVFTMTESGACIEITMENLSYRVYISDAIAKARSINAVVKSEALCMQDSYRCMATGQLMQYSHLISI
jgi:hypothetical protein